MNYRPPAQDTTPQGTYRGGKACVWFVRDDGIHHFQSTEPTRASTDEWLAHLDIIFAQVAPGEHVRYILDNRLGVPPLAYGAQRARAWLDANQNMNKTFVAFLHRDGSMMVLLNRFIHLLRATRVTTRFFDQLDDAVAWLHSIPPHETGA
ncbi:MAG: hypothetical protein NZ750_05005 [Anaerolineae bacterium]|nr:hypothetical protein [Anaerolineae bacterium]MDW8172136.1 hypothetical protein [Anaerolineae bacterium]